MQFRVFKDQCVIVLLRPLPLNDTPIKRDKTSRRSFFLRTINLPSHQHIPLHPRQETTYLRQNTTYTLLKRHRWLRNPNAIRKVLSIGRLHPSITNQRLTLPFCLPNKIPGGETYPGCIATATIEGCSKCTFRIK